MIDLFLRKIKIRLAYSTRATALTAYGSNRQQQKSAKPLFSEWNAPTRALIVRLSIPSGTWTKTSLRMAQPSGIVTDPLAAFAVMVTLT